MKIKDTKTPVLLVNCKLGALGVMRSLGSQGVPVHGADADPKAPGLLSRYCGEKYLKSLTEGKEGEFLDFLLGIGRKLRKSILIPTSDETAVFVCENAKELGRYFVFPKNDPRIMKALISKKEMYDLAVKHNVPTAYTEFPNNIDDVKKYCERAVFPVMVKGIFGNLLQARTGKKMVIVNSAQELIEKYKLLEDPERPNLMLQEYIPGGDDQIYIFNGYFNKDSDCLAAYTGHKIRQFPVHVGCSSLGICKWNSTVSNLTTRFMKEVGYKGILDIGYRYDARDGKYKVLDINPRIGQAFRLFLSRNGMDVARSLYLDLTGQEQFPIEPREGRKWIIEDFDLISSYHYYSEGTLGLLEWARSFKGVEEGAWFSLSDPAPFFNMSVSLSKRFFFWTTKKLNLNGKKRNVFGNGPADFKAGANTQKTP